MRAARDVVARALVPFVAASLRRASQRAAVARDTGDFTALVEIAFAFGSPRFKIAPHQVRSELLRLLEIVRELAPRRLLEIGTARGGTLFLLARAAAPDAELLSLDLPWSPHAGYARWRRAYYRSFALASQRVVPIQGDSHLDETLGRIRTALAGEPLDFLLIDGDHSRTGVERDWEMYAPLVRPGGLVAFHDIAPGPEKLVGGVPGFWRELRAALPGWSCDEIVETEGQEGCGLGLVRIPVDR